MRNNTADQITPKWFMNIFCEHTDEVDIFDGVPLHLLIKQSVLEKHVRNSLQGRGLCIFSGAITSLS